MNMGVDMAHDKGKESGGQHNAAQDKKKSII